jgi:hypothetical protein
MASTPSHPPALHAPISESAPGASLGGPAWLQSLPLARLAGVLLVVAAALLYALTLDNGLSPAELQGGDLITHQYAQVQARPSNAPGYPLYTMGGWLWFHGWRAVSSALGSPTPNPLPILSGYSTLWALLAIWLLYTLVRYVTSSRYRAQSPWGAAGNWPLALLLSAFYAVTYFFWYYATTTEQYTSAVAQTLAILLVYLIWQQADRDAGQEGYALRSRSGLLLVGLALLNGLSLAHMLTVAFITPPLVIAVLWQRPSLVRRGWLLLAVVAAAFLPLTAYWFVWVRGSTHPEWWGSGSWTTAGEWFRSFVSTAQGRDELSRGLEPGAPLLGPGFPALVWRELSLPLLLAGLGGIALLRRGAAFVLYGTLLLYAIFCWFYRFGNWFQVILPAYPLLLLGAAAAIDRLLEALRFSARDLRWLRAGVWLLLAAAVVWRVSESLPEANSRNRPGDSALERSALLVGAPPPSAALFAAVDDTLALEYLISIWGLRPDLIQLPPDKAPDAMEEGRPLLATWEAAATLLAEMNPPEGATALTLTAWNPDWALILPADGPQAVTPDHALPIDFATGEPLALLDGAIVLEGWAVQPAPSGAPLTDAPPALDVWLAWRLPDGWPEGVALSVRPLREGQLLPLPGAGEGAVSQVDLAAPLRAISVPNLGKAIDALRLPLPAPLPEGADSIALLFYRSDGAGGFTTLEELTLPLPPPAP